MLDSVTTIKSQTFQRVIYNGTATGSHWGADSIN